MQPAPQRPLLDRVVAAVFSVRPETALHYTIGTVDREPVAFPAADPAPSG